MQQAIAIQQQSVHYAVHNFI